jgi:hypothetical protein
MVQNGIVFLLGVRIFGGNSFPLTRKPGRFSGSLLTNKIRGLLVSNLFRTNCSADIGLSRPEARLY